MSTNKRIRVDSVNPIETLEQWQIIDAPAVPAEPAEENEVNEPALEPTYGELGAKYVDCLDSLLRSMKASLGFEENDDLSALESDEDEDESESSVEVGEVDEEDGEYDANEEDERDFELYAGSTVGQTGFNGLGFGARILGCGCSLCLSED